MTGNQRIISWMVVSLAAAVSVSGLIYTFLAVYGPLHVNLFGRPFPAWILGFMVTVWGGYTLYRLLYLLRRELTNSAG